MDRARRRHADPNRARVGKPPSNRRLGRARRAAARWAVGLLAGGALLAGGRVAAAQIYFQEVAGAFTNTGCNPAGCWTNYMHMTDIDGDLDLDVLFPNAPGFFSNGGNQPFNVYVNDGAGNFVNNAAAAVGGFSGQLRQVAVGDIDGDGDVDIYAPLAFGGPDKLFVNDGSGVFADEYAARMPANLPQSHAGCTRFGDVDGDGDLDLFVCAGYSTNDTPIARLYKNDGTGHFVDATAGLPTTKSGQDYDDIDLADVDRDFDLDVLINSHSGKSNLWLNDGTGTFTDATANLAGPASNNFHYGPAFCDVDGDGDLDLWIDNIGPSFTEQLMINDGTGHFTDETAARVSGNPGADDNGVACIDFDGDGDLDAAIMSLSNQERILVNDGTGHFALQAGTFSNASDGTLWFDFGDVNGDGKLDCVTGQGESSSLDRLYLGTASAPVDTVAPKIITTQATPPTVPANVSPVVHYAVSDNATTDEGPRLSKAFAKVSVDGGAASEIESAFQGGDLFRAALPAQTTQGASVSWQACATDRQGNEACSSAQTYLVDGAGGAGGAGGGGIGGGATGGSGTAGNGTGGSATGGNGTGGSGTGGDGTGNSGASGTGGSGTGNSGASPSGSGGAETDDGGCGCVLPGRSGDGGAAALAALGLLGLFAARRRR